MSPKLLQKTYMLYIIGICAVFRDLPCSANSLFAAVIIDRKCVGVQSLFVVNCVSVLTFRVTLWFLHLFMLISVAALCLSVV